MAALRAAAPDLARAGAVALPGRPAHRPRAATEVQALESISGAIKDFAADAPPSFGEEQREQCIQAAVASAQEQNATWTVEKLAWEIARHMPDSPAVP